MSNKNVPKEVRMGSIKSVIWKNETEAGVRYNVTFGRLYRDGKAWKQTDSFGRDDLLLLAKMSFTKADVPSHSTVRWAF
jgi:hypothetical protein